MPIRRCFFYILSDMLDSFKMDIMNYLGQWQELYRRIKKKVGTVKCNRVNKNGKTTSTTL